MRLLYIELMAEWCGKWGVEIWAYCLMPNHVHPIAVPSDTHGLHRAIGESHRRYTRHVNFREGWRGWNIENPHFLGFRTLDSLISPGKNEKHRRGRSPPSSPGSTAFQKFAPKTGRAQKRK